MAEKSIVQMQFDVTVELEYDPFKGKTIEQLAKTVEADLDDAIKDIRPELVYSYTGLTSVAEFDE